MLVQLEGEELHEFSRTTAASSFHESKKVGFGFLEVLQIERETAFQEFISVVLQMFGAYFALVGKDKGVEFVVVLGVLMNLLNGMSQHSGTVMC